MTFTRLHGQIGSCRGTAINDNDMGTFLVHFHGRAILDQGAWFFADKSLIIELKGVPVLVNLKNVALAISVG